MFVLRADPAHLQRICDRELQRPGASYRPLGPYVVLYAGNLVTWSTGIRCAAAEVGIWIPLVTTVHGHRALRTYSPYVWLDSATSALSGRAVYGYAKHTASVELPAVSHPDITVVGDAIVSADGDAQWCTERTSLLTATPVGPTATAGTSGFTELAAMFAHEVNTRASDVIALLGGMRSVFLKQLPAPAGTAASYQAIVEATITPHVDTVRGHPLEPWQIEIPAHHEPAIVDTLGLVATTRFDPDMKRVSCVRPLTQFWMAFRGRIDPGEEVWNASHEVAFGNRPG